MNKNTQILKQCNWAYVHDLLIYSSVYPSALHALLVQHHLFFLFFFCINYLFCCGQFCYT